MLTAASTSGSRPRRRIHLPRLAARASAVAWAALFVFEVVTVPPCTVAQPCRAPLGTLAFYATGLQITAVAVPLLLWFAPVGSLWFAAVTAVLLAVPDEYPWLWVGLGLVNATMAVVDALGRWRAARDAAEAASRDAEAGALARWRADRAPGRLLAWAPAALAAAACVGLLVWFALSLPSQRAFEEGATTITTRVVGVDNGTPLVDNFGTTVPVGGDGGVNETYQTGQEVEVLVNRNFPAKVELVAEPNDPTWRLGLAGIAGAAALWWWGAMSRDRRLAHRAMRRTPVVDRVRVLATVDGQRVLDGPWPLATLTPLSGEESPPPAPTPAPALATMTREDLGNWGDQEMDRLLEVAPWAWIPGSSGPEEVEVLGPWLQDSVVVVAQGERRMLARLRDPWGVRRVLRARSWRPDATDARPAPRRGRPQVTQDDDDPAVRAKQWGRWSRLWWRWGPSLRWVAAPLVAAAVAVAGAWMLSDPTQPDPPGWGSLAMLLLLAVSFVSSAAGLGAGRIMPHPQGVVRLGGLRDEVWSSTRVSAVVTGRDSLVIRLREPQDAVALSPFAVTGPEGGDAERLVSQWLASAAMAARTQRESRWRLGPLGPSLIVGVAMFFACQTVWPATLPPL